MTNCIISDTDYYFGQDYPSIILSSGGGHQIFGNTVTRSGRSFVGMPGTVTEIAYNDLSWGCMLTRDGGGLYAFGVDMTGTKIHHNWVHNVLVGIYLDNYTRNCSVYRNVCFDDQFGIQLNSPGTNHLVYNNTLMRNWGSSIPVPYNDSGTPTQAGTQVINNLADSSMSFVSDCTTNKNGWFPPVGTNFVPQAGSAAIDAGQTLPGYTDGYLGSAPDIGAYETGGTYWTPGASFTIPPFPTPGSASAPPAPANVTVTPANNDVSLGVFWIASPTAVSYYIVKRSTNSGGPYTTVATVMTGTFYGDTNVMAGQAYYYVVSAGNSSGAGANSTEASGVPVEVAIVDNLDTTGVTVAGSWLQSLLYGTYGYDALVSSTPGASVTFRPNLPLAGNYQVYVNWSAKTNRVTNAPIDVKYATGTSTFSLNQQVNGGTWNLLGTFAFNAGTNGSVVVRCTSASGFVVADAVKFVLVPPATPINFTGATVSGGSISLVATGAISAPYRLWGTSNLALPMSNWAALVSNTVTASPFTNTDLAATNSPQRFYRLSTP